ncbi:MAG: substrate-binding domain-containing protein [bacterium]|nr:substrate-binding domain-containing protein [bacterium]
MSDNDPASNKQVPRVRVTQDPNTDPMRVVVVDDNQKRNTPSIGCLALVIFLSSLMGTLIGLGADLGELIGNLGQIQEILNPPPRLCIAGSDTMLGTLSIGPKWETAFEALHRADVHINATGSTNGVKLATEGGCVNLLAMSEPMTAPQYDSLTQAGIGIECAAEVGFDVVAFVTNINNPMVNDVRNPDNPDDVRPPVRPILFNEISGILRGTVNDWSQLSNWSGIRNTTSNPINIWVRPGSGTTEFVLNNVARHIITEEAQFPPNALYLRCESNEACLNKTLETPGSIYWVSIAWMKTQPPNYLRAISILEGDTRPINPLSETINLQEYPKTLIRPIYLYALNNPQTTLETIGLSETFMTFARSVEGQLALEQVGFYTHFARPAEVPVPFPESYFNIQEGLPRQICKLNP